MAFVSWYGTGNMLSMFCACVQRTVKNNVGFKRKHFLIFQTSKVLLNQRTSKFQGPRKQV